MHRMHVFLAQLVDGIQRLFGRPARSKRGRDQTHFSFLLKLQIEPLKSFSCSDDMFVVGHDTGNSFKLWHVDLR